ncbi:hypothetical protein LSAT2_011040 [Lamellibrachia satsuma]|nr:hypothetical protein LSAT2_011040 [Lamellibrachia satsuma]
MPMILLIAVVASTVRADTVTDALVDIACSRRCMKTFFENRAACYDPTISDFDVCTKECYEKRDQCFIPCIH